MQLGQGQPSTWENEQEGKGGGEEGKIRMMGTRLYNVSLIAMP